MIAFPLIWKNLLKRYFKVLLLCTLSFVSILLLTRLQEIARFAVLAANIKVTFLFTLYQIPYILPLSLPISGLIAGIILFQQMSRTGELTALRASGLSTWQILMPLIFSGLLLAIVNFYFTSEVTSYCRMRSKDLVYETTTANPLVLIQKGKMMKLRDSYVDMTITEKSKEARNLFFALHTRKNEHLSLLFANKIKIDHGLLRAKNVALIHTIDSKLQDNYNHLVIENQKTLTAKAKTLSEHMKSARSIPNPEFLPFRWMLIKGKTDSNPKTARRLQVEMARRFSLTLAAFTFTLIGAIFGMEIGRERKKKNLLFALLSASFVLISFAMAKSFHASALKASLLFLAPHPIAITFAFLAHKKFARGIEK